MKHLLSDWIHKIWVALNIRPKYQNIFRKNKCHLNYLVDYIIGEKIDNFLVTGLSKFPNLGSIQHLSTIRTFIIF